MQQSAAACVTQKLVVLCWSRSSPSNGAPIRIIAAHHHHHHRKSHSIRALTRSLKIHPSHHPEDVRFPSPPILRPPSAAANAIDHHSPTAPTHRRTSRSPRLRKRTQTPQPQSLRSVVYGRRPRRSRLRANCAAMNAILTDRQAVEL